MLVRGKIALTVSYQAAGQPRLPGLCKKKGKHVIIISCNEISRDKNLIVIQDPNHPIISFIDDIGDSQLINELIEDGYEDDTRGNYKIDTGFASAMCQS